MNILIRQLIRIDIIGLLTDDIDFSYLTSRGESHAIMTADGWASQQLEGFDRATNTGRCYSFFVEADRSFGCLPIDGG